MNIALSGPSGHLLKGTIDITGSKSESNRLLLLQALYPNLKLANMSISDDAEAMQKGLRITRGEVDIHHAGTAMRFLTAYHAGKEGHDVVLTGSSRMQERPIKILVDALRQLGADISYLKREGFPPIRIKGQSLLKEKVSLPASVSSQYVSALILMAPHMQKGLELELTGQITSLPYIKMTLKLLEQIGVTTSFEANRIGVQPKETVPDQTIVIESDWSSASYFYSIAALSEPGTELVLSSFREKSLQGDRIISDIYRDFGVTTRFGKNTMVLNKMAHKIPELIEADLTHAPDLAQTLTVTCFGLGTGCHLTGLHTLKIKETDRLEALKMELTKFGAMIRVTEASLNLRKTDGINEDVDVATYNDHRMAMAFAPLALKTPLKINNAEVVSKSYPGFWTDLEVLGFQVKTL